MALMHGECESSSLSYSDVPMTQTAIEHSYTQYLHPKSILTGENPLVFEIQGNTDFIDLAHTQLKLALLLHNGDASALAVEQKSAPVNLILHSLFSQVQLGLRDQQVTHSNNLYPYRAYFETLLSYSKGVKENWLQAEGWEEDDAGKFDSGDNTALAKRQAAFLGGKVVEFKGRLHLDCGYAEKLLPSQLDARLVLTRSKSVFNCMALTAGANVYVEIKEAVLYVQRRKLAIAKNMDFERQIAAKNIRIPINHVVVKSATLSAGVTTFDCDGLFSGILPHTIVLGFVENQGFSGAFGKNPFNFQHFGLCSLGLRVNGRNLPTRPLTPDYTNNRYLDAYQTLFEASDQLFANEETGITPAKYIGGSCLYAFGTGADSCAEANPLISGTVDISARFATALTTTVSLVIYASFKNNIFIDKTRNVVSDISS